VPPVFPSLIDEGSLGYDLELPIAGSPIFFQFKLSDHMVRSTAEGADKVPIPHYRMHIRPLKHSQQHDLLLALENRGQTVFYAAPEFHRPDELNEAYAGKEIIQRSAFFSPKAIGSLPDKGEHFICFNANAGHGYLCSEPIKVESVASTTILKILSSDIVDIAAAQLPARAYLKNVADDLISEWEKRLRAVDEQATISATGMYSVRAIDVDDELIRKRLGLLNEIRETRGAIEYLGWVAQTLFDSTVFVRLRKKKEKAST
jgi:hypothetical protein